MRHATVGGYWYVQPVGALEPVEGPDVPGDRPSLGEPAPVVLPDEPAVQLVPPGLLGPEDALYQGPLSVLAIAEHAGCLPPVRLATVDSILPLLDVGDHAHPEQQLAVVVRVVPLVPVKEIPRKVKPATPDLSQHDWKHGRVVDVAGRGERRQHDLQAQDGRYVVFPVGLLACLDEVALLPAWPLDVFVPSGLRRAAVGSQRARRLVRLLDATAGRLGHDQIEPVCWYRLEVPDQCGMVRDGLVVPWCPHASQVRFDSAIGVVACHHQQTGKVQFLLGVNRGTAPVAVFSARARVLPDYLDQRPLQTRCLDFLCQFIVLPVSFPSVVFAHCRVREIADH